MLHVCPERCRYIYGSDMFFSIVSKKRSKGFEKLLWGRKETRVKPLFSPH